MARTKEYDRSEVLDAATRVFWAKGFKGTSVGDLVTATGLGKRSMYQEFDSKESLFRECIDNYVLRLNKEASTILNHHPLGMKNIVAFFRNRINYASSCDCCGCLVVNTAIEKELIDEAAFEQIKKYLSRHEESFLRCLEAAQANGEIAAGKNCRVLASYLLTFSTGMMAMSKTGPSREALEDLVEVALSSIKA